MVACMLAEEEWIIECRMRVRRVGGRPAFPANGLITEDASQFLITEDASQFLVTEN